MATPRVQVKKKTGRPSDYRPEYCDLLRKHMAKGLSFEAFGGVVDACRQTLYTWCKEHPEFLDTKRRGTLKGQLFWEEAGIAGLWHGGEGGQNFNSSVWIFNMKNRFGWRDSKSQNEPVKTTPIILSYDPSQKLEEK